tara:strand:+ start:749 stop:1024 length:276 start_codon:yes stop_codon:yes gene_type:complete
MNFLEDLELYNNAMYNAYDFITGRTDLDYLEDRMNYDDLEDYPLPFNPYEEDGKSSAVIDIVISHFITLEEYEKCAELTKIKEECENDSEI